MKNKTLIIVAIAAIILAVGAGAYFMLGDKKGSSKGAKLDLVKIQEEIPNLTSDKVELNNIGSGISNGEKPLIPEDVEYFYLGSLKEKLNITEENFKDSIIALSAKGEGYLAFDTVKDKEKLDKEVADVFKKYGVTNYEASDVDGIKVYLNTADNKEALNRIKGAKSPLFAMLMPQQKESFSDMFGIDPKLVEEGIAALPMINVQSNMYIIVKPVNGKKEEVKTAVNAYMGKLEKQWETYLADQHELVVNRLEKEEDGYLIYIISRDNEKVYNAIKTMKLV
ncbi:MAG: DUF4358 domain-containing protein [Clostridia bacterium]